VKRIATQRKRVTRRHLLKSAARGAGAATLVILGLGATPALGKATRKKATRKKATRKKATRKKATRKKATRKKTTRKKAARKKAARKKASRRHLAEEVTSFFDVDEYLDAAGEEFLFLDFDPAPTEPGLVSGDSFSPEILFSSPEASDPSKVVHSGTADNGAITDAGSTTAPNGVGLIAGEFAMPASALAFEILSTGESPTTLLLFDEDDEEIDAVPGPPGGGFFGVVSSVPIASWELLNGTLSNGYPDRYFLDNFGAA
jgi:hypothetical protein